MLTRVFKSIFFAFSGLLLFIQIHNRLILMLKKGPLRSILTVCIFGVLVFILGSCGLVYQSNVLNLFVVSIISCCLIVEIWQRIRKNTLRVKETVYTCYWNEQPISGKLFQDTSEHLIIRRFCHSPPTWKTGAYRIAHLSDLHIDKHTSDDFLGVVFDALVSIKPNIVLVTGDFTDQLDQLQRLVPFFKNLSPPHGILGVLGNHDFWINDRTVRKILESCNMQFPSHKGLILQTDQAQTLIFHGVEYPYAKPWLFEASKLDQQQTTIVLAHTPDIIFKLARIGVDMVFSGHLHGGQWRLPVIGSVVSPSIYDRLLDHGHYKILDTHLFVTAGIGRVWIPKRVNCPAEILVVDLEEAQDPSPSGR